MLALRGAASDFYPANGKIHYGHAKDSWLTSSRRLVAAALRIVCCRIPEDLSRCNPDKRSCRPTWAQTWLALAQPFPFGPSLLSIASSFTPSFGHQRGHRPRWSTTNPKDSKHRSVSQRSIAYQLSLCQFHTSNVLQCKPHVACNRYAWKGSRAFPSSELNLRRTI